jgi:peptidoglycan/xylan/chitin deacetylase (PgdA/CDA1 family)
MNPLRSLVRRGRAALHRQLRARGLILIYHRVTEERNDPWRLGVTPERFADQLETLRGLGLRIVSVSQLARELAEGKPRRGSIALSFDDGYQDNLSLARPLLERFDVPATLFATSGYIGSGEEFWWDALERVFLQPSELPQLLELTVGDETYRCDLGADAELTPARSESLLNWRPFQDPPTARHRAHDELWQLLVQTAPVPRSKAVADLLDWAGLPRRARDSHRTLTADELRTLARDDLVEIGAHSINHPGLGSMPKPIRMKEIAGSKAELEKILGRPVRGFSYPQGRSSLEVQSEARDAGYAFACGSVYEAVTAKSQLFHMPRVSARDWDGARLRALVARHLPL